MYVTSIATQQPSARSIERETHTNHFPTKGQNETYEPSIHCALCTECFVTLKKEKEEREANEQKKLKLKERGKREQKD